MKKKSLIFVLVLALLIACTPTEQNEEIETEEILENEEVVEEVEESEETEEKETEELEEGLEELEAIIENIVDFSDIEGAKSLVVGEVDDELMGALLIDSESGSQINFYEIENHEKYEKFSVILENEYDFISAISGDDDNIVFSAVDEEAEEFTIYRVINEGETIVHSLYKGEKTELDYGQNLVADDDIVFFTSDTGEDAGFYFTHIMMLEGDSIQILNAEIVPVGAFSMVLDDGHLIYGALRDDQQFIIDYDYEDNVTLEYALAGDSSEFRVTDEDDGKYILDNYNGHPDREGSFVLIFDSETGEIQMISEEGSNLHSGYFENDEILLAESIGNKFNYVKYNLDGERIETQPAYEVPANSAILGFVEDDGKIIRYPVAINPEFYKELQFKY